MLLYYKVFNIFHTVIYILFFTSPYNIFVFQSMFGFLIFFTYIIILLLFLSTLYYFVMVFLYTISLSLSLSLSPLATYRFPKFDDDSNIKYVIISFLLLFKFSVSNLIFFFFLWCIGCENECFPSITPLNVDNFIYLI